MGELACVDDLGQGSMGVEVRPLAARSGVIMDVLYFPGERTRPIALRAFFLGVS